eukprot:scaffold107933_cov34-Attheya_sp.AAC.1
MVEKNNQHPIDHERGNHNRDADSRDRASIFDNHADEETTRVREGIQEQRRSMDLASKLFRRLSARQAGVGAFHMIPREEERKEEDDEDPVVQDHSVEAEVDVGSYRYGHSTATPAGDTQSQIPIVTLVGTHPQINSSLINSLRASSAQAAVVTPPNPWEPKERLARICVSFMGIAALIMIVLTIMVFTMGDESTDASSDTDSNLIPTASPSLTIMLHSCSPSNGQIRECEWFGVTCANQESHFDIITGISVRDPDFGTVKAIEIRDLVLTGHIPNELGIFLPFLRRIDQEEWTTLNLVNLNLGWNKLSGPIDAYEWTSWNMEKMALAFNMFNGTIPTSLGSLSNIQMLDLSRNELDGSISEEIMNLAGLREIDLKRNNLKGTLPSSMSSSLETIDFSYNSIEGTMPLALCNLLNLETLHLAGNELDGSIPVEMGNMTGLQDLFLYSNYLTGNIPAEFSKLKSLFYVDLRVNEMSGMVPYAICKLREENLQSIKIDCHGAMECACCANC